MCTNGLLNNTDGVFAPYSRAFGCFDLREYRYRSRPLMPANSRLIGEYGFSKGCRLLGPIRLLLAVSTVGSCPQVPFRPQDPDTSWLFHPF